jgi:hypothetical protein
MLAVQAHQSMIEERVQVQLRRAVSACLALFSEFSHAAVESQQCVLHLHHAGWLVPLILYPFRHALDCCEGLYHETVASVKSQYQRQLEVARAACQAEVCSSSAFCSLASVISSCSGVGEGAGGSNGVAVQ